MAIAVAEVLSDIQLLLAEGTVDGGVTWSSGLWTLAEVLGYIQEENRRLILQTACLLARDTSVVVVPGTQIHTLPDDVLQVYSCAFVCDFLSVTVPLLRADRLQTELVSDDSAISPGNPLPYAYTTGELPSQQIALLPASNLPGILDMIKVQRPTDLARTDSFIIPDELVGVVEWGVLATMLGNLVGGSESPEGTLYARLRAGEQQAVVEILLRGGF